MAVPARNESRGQSFLGSAAFYAILSRNFPYDPKTAGSVQALQVFFRLDSPLLLLPLELVLLPAFTRLKLRGAILLSTAAAAGIAVLYQNVDPWLALKDLTFGYQRPINHPQLQLLFGDGFQSMIKPMITVFLSGALPPLLSELGVLTRYQDSLGRLAQKTYPFVLALASGILTSAIGCSQTLTVLVVEGLSQRGRQW